MAKMLTYTCDVCKTTVDETPTSSSIVSFGATGWYRLKGRDLCSLPCVGAFAADADAYPAQALRPDPLLQHLNTGSQRGSRAVVKP